MNDTFLISYSHIYSIIHRRIFFSSTQAVYSIQFSITAFSVEFSHFQCGWGECVSSEFMNHFGFSHHRKRTKKNILLNSRSADCIGIRMIFSKTRETERAFQLRLFFQ